MPTVSGKQYHNDNNGHWYWHWHCNEPTANDYHGEPGLGAARKRE
jgi:hypothetical protein